VWEIEDCRQRLISLSKRPRKKHGSTQKMSDSEKHQASKIQAA
jgi:hypothetical protein